MTDIFSREKRRAIMQAVRRRGTKPEQVVARGLRRLGTRFRRHAHRLPGCPDFYIPEANAALFVHGCFWHGHGACRKGRERPKSNAPYWAAKIERNKRRDRRVTRRLRANGLAVYVVWECEMRSGGMPARIATLLRKRSAELRTGNARQAFAEH